MWFPQFFMLSSVFGKSFVRRMYAKYSAHIDLKYERHPKTQKSKLVKSYHHIRIDQEFKADCAIWLTFLQDSDLHPVVYRPMVDILGPAATSSDLFFYSDTSAAPHLGFGCIFQNNWIFARWECGFVKDKNPSIEYLELFVLCAGLLTWGDQLNDIRMTVFCDNTAVVSMINNITAKCKNCMWLLRLITLEGLQHNRHVFAKYVRMKSNFLADSLSRLKIKKFKKLAPSGVNPNPDRISSRIWPVSKIWID